MPVYQYRAVRADGSAATGRLEAADHAHAVAGVRNLGAIPLELALAPDAGSAGAKRLGGKARALATNAIGELAVLLKAGIPLDRALALVIENIEDRPTIAAFAEILAQVREGAPLSRAMAARPELFSATAIAMAEAGEANGKLSSALTRLALMLEQADDLRRLVTTSMIYPIALLVIAVSVVLLMLLFVVPQFEAVFATAKGQLPAASLAVMAASRALRDYGLVMLAGLVALFFVLRILLARPGAKRARDRIVLRIPQFGTLVRYIETARFARTLGALVDGEVPLPAALALSRRTIGNTYMGEAVARVAQGVKEGSGLTAPLAAAKVMPRIAISFLRTGEESSQLGPMLDRLADVLDRDVRIRLERLIGVLTPAITVILGAAVATIIASIMSAILGFNDLAIAQ